MEQQRYDPFDIDKGADKVFLIGSSFIVLFLFLLWSEFFYVVTMQRVWRFAQLVGVDIDINQFS